MIHARALALSGTLLASIHALGDSSGATGPANGPATYSVSIEDLQFRPSQLTVHPGDWIVFSNKDLFPHNVAADGKAFDSLGIAANASWRYRAGKPGVYGYHCVYHPTMTGRVTVR